MRLALVIVLLAACGADGSGPGPSDGALNDGNPIGDGAIDGPAGKQGVVCNDENTSCPVPAQFCCDVFNGADMCVASNGQCNGDRMECDGPEDCPSTQECCLFEGQGSRCLDAGICGTTGSISNEMCHIDMDCDAGEVCCGRSPGPGVDLYYTCRIGNACPQ